MENVSDFFKELKARVSNPLIGSYIISWLVINWKIPIALLYYNENQLHADGVKTYNDFISNHLTVWYSILPLLVAVAYVIFFPMIRNEVSQHLTKYKTKNEVKNIEISKAGYVPTAKYLEVIEAYKKTRKYLKRL